MILIISKNNIKTTQNEYIELPIFIYLIFISNDYNDKINNIFCDRKISI